MLSQAGIGIHSSEHNISPIDGMRAGKKVMKKLDTQVIVKDLIYKPLGRTERQASKYRIAR